MSTNAAPRDLLVIANEIRARTETIADVIEIGGLLLEAQDQLEHGDWLPWLEREFDFSERTAQNYMAVHRFAAKYETVADLKLTCSALYSLATRDDCEPDEIQAVLAAAAKERVSRSDVREIVTEARSAKEAAEEEASKSKSDVDDTEDADVETDDEYPNSDEFKGDDSDADDLEAAAQAEAEAILDGPPPELPSTEPTPIVDFLLPTFDQAVGKIRELSSKPSDKFLNGSHSANDLEAAADFLRHVAWKKGGDRLGSQPEEVSDDRIDPYLEQWSRYCKPHWIEMNGSERERAYQFQQDGSD